MEGNGAPHSPRTTGAAAHERRPPRADWIQPPADEEGLARLARTLRERVIVVAASMAVVTVAALLYVAGADRVYEAQANLLITPVSGEDAALSSLGLLQQSNDPLRPIETAAVLATTSEVAREAAAELEDPRSPQQLAEDIRAEPVAESDLVALTASAGTPEEARDLANAFASKTVALRTQEFQREVGGQIRSLNAQLEQLPFGATAEQGALGAQLARLRTLSEAPIPDMRVETLAELPTSAVAPRPLLSLFGAMLAGLVLGMGAAFALDSLDPRLRREEQLRRLYRIPILARIPREPAKTTDPLAPASLSTHATEAYRTLRGTLAASGGRARQASRTILVTGSAPAEGKTTTAINLATSLAMAGKSVILIDADLRRPAIARAMGMRARDGIVSVLIESAELEDVLVSSPAHGPKLGMLLAEHEGGWITELFTLPSAQRLLDDARRAADYVVVDSPPLTEVIDALPLARGVDDVLVVARLGKSRMGSIRELAELLAENEIRPAGFAVIGAPRPQETDYYLDPERDGRRLTRSGHNGTQPTARPGAGAVRRGASQLARRF